MERFAERRRWARGDVRAQRLDDRLVRHDRFFVTTPVEHDGTVRVRATRELAHEARLADARLAGDQRYLPRTVGRLRPRPFERAELSLAAGERLVVAREGRERQGESAGKGLDRLQGRKLGPQAGDGQLVDAFGPGKALQAVLTEVQEVQPVGEAAAHELGAGVRQHRLAAVRRGHDPARPVNGGAVVVTVAQLRGSRVHPDPDHEWPCRAPWLRIERSQCVDCHRDCVTRGDEHCVDTVATRLHDLSVVLRDRFTEDLVVTRQRGLHVGGVRFPERCGILEIGEQEGDGSGRQRARERRRRRRRA